MFPVSTGIQVPARTFGKVQTSTAHAVEEWTPCCHRLLTEFLNLQVLNAVEVSDNQRLSYYDYYLFTFCFLIHFFLKRGCVISHNSPSNAFCG